MKRRSSFEAEKLAELVLSLIIIIFLLCLMVPMLSQYLHKQKLIKKSNEIFLQIKRCKGTCYISLPSDLDLVYLKNKRKLCTAYYDLVESSTPYKYYKYEIITCKPIDSLGIKDVVFFENRNFWIDYLLYKYEDSEGYRDLSSSYSNIWDAYNELRDVDENVAFFLRINPTSDCRQEVIGGYSTGKTISLINEIVCNSKVYIGEQRVEVTKGENLLKAMLIDKHTDRDVALFVAILPTAS